MAARVLDGYEAFGLLAELLGVPKDLYVQKMVVVFEEGTMLHVYMKTTLKVDPEKLKEGIAKLIQVKEVDVSDDCVVTFQEHSK